MIEEGRRAYGIWGANLVGFNAFARRIRMHEVRVIVQGGVPGFKV